MAGKFWLWNLTAGSNASSDPSINWAEGQAPSSVNDSARAMMAAIASYRNDVNGSQIVGGGSATTYTLTTSQAFSSVSDLDGQEFTFVITPTNGAGATLNVNGIGAFPLVFSAGNPMPAGTMVDGSIYTATFSNSLSCFKVRSFFGSTFNIPVGGMMDYICPTVPNANFVFPTGQAISRTTYAPLFSLVGTTYGVGDGTTTFNVPNLSGRVTAMKEASASLLTPTYFGGNSTVLGAVGGIEHEALATTNLPPQTPAGTNSGGQALFSFTTSSYQAGGNTGVQSITSSTGFATVFHDSTFVGTSFPGQNSTPFATVQPTLIVNKILRII